MKKFNKLYESILRENKNYVWIDDTDLVFNTGGMSFKQSLDDIEEAKIWLLVQLSEYDTKQVTLNKIEKQLTKINNIKDLKKFVKKSFNGYLDLMV